jgi:hypothetical protein
MAESIFQSQTMFPEEFLEEMILSDIEGDDVPPHIEKIETSEEFVDDNVFIDVNHMFTNVFTDSEKTAISNKHSPISNKNFISETINKRDPNIMNNPVDLDEISSRILITSSGEKLKCFDIHTSITNIDNEYVFEIPKIGESDQEKPPDESSSEEKGWVPVQKKRVRRIKNRSSKIKSKRERKGH